MVMAAVASSQSAIQIVVVFVAAAIAGDRLTAPRPRGLQQIKWAKSLQTLRGSRYEGSGLVAAPLGRLARLGGPGWRAPLAPLAGVVGRRRGRRRLFRLILTTKMAPKNVISCCKHQGAPSKATHTESIAPASSSLPLPLLAPGDRMVRLLKDGGWVGISSSCVARQHAMSDV